MIIHLTEKLRKRLQLPPLPSAVPFPAGAPDTRAHGALQWYGNTFETGGVTYILTTNAASLYSVVLAAGDLGDERAYVRAFLGALETQMKADGLAALYDEVIAPASGEVVLAKTADRKVLGTMKVMAQECAIGVAYLDASPAELSERINGNLYSMHRRETPRETFARLTRSEETTE